MLRNNMDAAEYKHIVLGLIFLKYISDAFEAKHAELAAAAAAGEGADPEDPDEYKAQSIFWVPREARWSHLKAQAPQPTIGRTVDDAMDAIKRENPTLKGVLPKDFARPGLDKARLAQLINLVSDIGLGSPADRAKDILGCVYEYFLAQFASATPSRVVRVLVEMLAPYKGRAYDPSCGRDGIEYPGRVGDISIYGQESNYTTWRLANMNLAIRGIEANLGAANAGSFHADALAPARKKKRSAFGPRRTASCRWTACLHVSQRKTANAWHRSAETAGSGSSSPLASFTSPWQQGRTGAFE
jgi:type I restriction enzyme M protein